MRIPPPLCRHCLEAADLELFRQAPDGLALIYCEHYRTLVHVTVAGHVPVHWVADHPCTPEAAADELAKSRRELHRAAN